MERVPFLSIFVNRHFSITCFLQPEDVSEAISLIKQFSLPDRFRIILYVDKPKRDSPLVFPINKLRNIAMVNIVTSHFLILDMDMWPVRTLFDEVQKAPLDVLKNPMSAIIIPLMFFNQDRILGFCSSFESCMRRYV